MLILVQSCQSPYKHLRRTPGDPSCIVQFRPRLNRALYYTRVQVIGKEISGLLLMKKMEDSSIRLVFSNPTGFKFFDFGFLPDSGFRVYYIIKQMDKKALIRTLKNDFAMILMNNLNFSSAYMLRDEHNHFYAFPQEKDLNYYITDTLCSGLERMERTSGKKPGTVAIMQNYQEGLPDTIGITHKKFHFTIGLKRIAEDATK